MILYEQKAIATHEDARGVLWEVLRRDDLGDNGFGQLYVVIAHPGQTRGNHFHRRKTESFVAVRGRAVLELWPSDQQDFTVREVSLDASIPGVVTVPPGICHRFTNVGNEELIVLAHADEPFDPGDPDTEPAPVNL